MAKLTDFMVSRVRVKMIQTFLSHPGEMFYVRQLTRETKEEINAVRRELQRMEKSGMLKSEHRGNRLYYFFKPSYLFYQELLSLVAKTTGLGKAIIKNRQKLGQIKFAMFSGKYVRGLPRSNDDVELLIVGQVILPQLAILIRENEAKTGQEINYTVMTEDELKFRKNRRDPFILQVLSNSRVMLVGDEQELVS
ncbi:MAG: hypothetical protein BWY29_00252 [Microgenomates group bacterium ADurb.Bin238]|uniref:Transcriptional regulator n=1 Tax=Candidatus Chazhemtobacterium aquaticus TaxID=2715735 RepID=A0A857NCX7_9BACT|nr:hypothetical protein [Candidatus Chazhemtobacterium aquaticus]OQA83395.1 MAG: hypothetical protein BWY29_00252 [Microgenomates group bacterium ADurb.Bin238]QHO63331.1 Transcriptional regulator [Candidatus Chazhemtobacterium aquaticus]